MQTTAETLHAVLIKVPTHGLFLKEELHHSSLLRIELALDFLDFSSLCNLV